MAQINFTDRWLRNIAPKGPQSEFIDAACPNLRVRVGKRSKTFSVMIGDAGPETEMRRVKSINPPG